MISKEAVMGIASLFRGRVNPEVVSKAYDFTVNVMNTSKTPQEALLKGNVTPETIDKAQGLLSNPFAELILNRFNLGKRDVLPILSQAKSLVGNASPQTVQGDELSVYRNAIQQIK